MLHGLARAAVRRHAALRAASFSTALLFSAQFAAADGGVTFSDIASDPASGLAFEKGRSASFPAIAALQEQSLAAPLSPADAPFNPYNAYGQPGVALLDYDRDGDQDIYVTSGIDSANALFSNQLMETGQAVFIEQAGAAGVTATDQDGMGVCAGDIDNDGYPDLLVLGRDSANRLFHNQGDGTFYTVVDSGLEGDDRSAPSCSMGDVNNDGLVDVTIANSVNHGSLVGCVIEPFALNQHNQLFLNNGDGTFTDVSAASGVESMGGLPPGAAGVTWATGMVDIDKDGDIDIVYGDDQCAYPTVAENAEVGIDRGFIHVLLNDGTGQFTDQPVIVNDFSVGSWMGLGFGDLNCDGHLDIFGSNFGDYGFPSISVNIPPNAQATRWLLGNGDGTFVDSAANGEPTVFGWGNAVFDYDNDGDQDVVYHGGLDFNYFPKVADNPGVVLQNQSCQANFALDTDAIDRSALAFDHSRRNTQAVAVADLDQNGFVDIVSASAFNVPEPIPLVPSPAQFGFPLDATAFAALPFTPGPAGFVWNETDYASGNLAVEMNSGGNRNRWVSFTLMGTKGLIRDGAVNRDGIGAVVTFTPRRGVPVMVPVVAGSSFASQHSLEAHFGMGKAHKGDVEVLWPGGVRNRLYRVNKFERLTLPEIPCSFDADWPTNGAYKRCLQRAFRDLRRADLLTEAEVARLNASMQRAFRERQ